MELPPGERIIVTDQDRLTNERFWDQRYGGAAAVWSGKPNQRLVDEVSDLEPGTAVDIGCGEGGDALWLAERGWRVQAVDFSRVGLARAKAEAGAREPAVADRVEWVHGDVTTWQPASHVDLVTAHFIHLPAERFGLLFENLVEMVAPGGVLLIVGHHPSDRDVVPRPHDVDRYFTAEDLAARLDPERWEVLAAEARSRSATHPDGHPVTIHDAVFCARRCSD